jgi:hypothetical protein
MGVRCVDTIANLKAINTATLGTATSNNTVLVNGYYAAGDGGGGYFQWISSSAAAADDGGVVAPNAGGGRWLRRIDEDVVTVKQWGARGDAATDDTARIQACLNYASANNIVNVVVPGVVDHYRVTTTINIPANITLSGVGHASALKMTTTSGSGGDVTQPNVLNINGSFVTIQRIRIFGLNVDSGPYSPSASGTSAGIKTNNGAIEHIVIRDCIIHNIIQSGMLIVALGDIYITCNVLFSNNGNKSVDIEVAGNIVTGQLNERCVITDNWCLSNNDRGIAAGTIFSKEHIIARNHCVALIAGAPATFAASQRRHGIIVAYTQSAQGNGTRFVISDNVIRHTKWTGIYINDGTGGWTVGPYVITGNYISDVGYADSVTAIDGGISLTGTGKGDVVTGNRIERTYGVCPGIRLSQSQSSADDKTCVIANNVMTECYNAGLSMYLVPHNAEITGNMFRNNLGDDIAITLQASSSLEHKLMICDNVFHRNNSAAPSIDIDQQNSTCVLWVHRNQFFGAGSATLADANSAIFTKNRQVNVRENYIKSYYYGVHVQPYIGFRDLLLTVDDNYFENVNTAVRAERTSTTPILPISSNRFQNVATKAGPAGVICKRNPAALTQYASAAPTTGTWVAGDIVYNSAPAVGQPIGWMRTSTAWRSMGNLA